MPRAERHSFPMVHSLYLSREQDARLRRLARKSGKTVSETLRAALDAFFEAQGLAPGPADVERPEPTRAQTRAKIADAARARKRERGPRNAPVWPGQRVAGGTAIWQPPPHFAPPGDDGELELARDRDGLPFEPPPNAVAWLVLYQRRAQDQAQPYAWNDNGQRLLIRLDTSIAQFSRLVGRRMGWFTLQLVDRQGRLLRAKQGVFAFD